MQTTFLCLLIWIGVLNLASSQEAQQACRRVMQCMEVSRKQIDICQDFPKRGRGRGRKNADPCRDEIRRIRQDLKSKQEQQHQQKTSCIQNRLSQAKELLKPRKQEKCDELMGQSLPVPKTVDYPELPTEGRLTRDQRKQRRQAKRECRKEIKRIRKQCKTHFKCCSEARICHLEFETSSLHDDIRRLQLQMIKKNRECPRKKRGRGRGGKRRDFEGRNFEEPIDTLDEEDAMFADSKLD